MKHIIGTMLVLAVAATAAQAGAKIKINENTDLDLGMRVQALGIMTEADRDGDGSMEADHDFKVRRARFRLKSTIADSVSAFIQTDAGSGTGDSGLDMRIIDAFVTLPVQTVDIYAGLHMAPASRQNLTSSGALMAIDRPGMNYKTLTWGSRSVYAFANRTYGDSDSTLRGEADVRDMGTTAVFNHSASEDLHFKVYAGAYDGVPGKGEDSFRTTVRAQVNLMDSETGYFHSATYLGKKQTVSIGAGIDQQSDVGTGTDGAFDYSFQTIDIFAETPLHDGSLTIEAAYEVLDFDDATGYDHDSNPLTTAIDMRRAQGNGYYVQAGYLLGKVQPWVEYEDWNSDATDEAGSYSLVRAGISYFISGQSANVKLGWERLDAEKNIGTTTADTIDSVVLGCYVTY